MPAREKANTRARLVALGATPALDIDLLLPTGLSSEPSLACSKCTELDTARRPNSPYARALEQSCLCPQHASNELSRLSATFKSKVVPSS